MKTTQKFQILLAMIVSLCFFVSSSAQETTVVAPSQATTAATNYDQGFRLGFGLNAGVPTDDDVYTWSLGGDVRLQYDFSKRTSITLTSGFTNLFIDGDDNDLGFIPIKAGFKAFVWEDRFYVLGEVGGGLAVTNGYEQDTYLWSPGIGYANNSIDISLRYESYIEYNTDQIALRIAYGFKL